MLLGLAVVVPCASAQSVPPPSWPHLELWGAVTTIPSGQLGTLVSSYSPPLLLDGDYTSHANQTLTLKGAWHPGVEAGANLFVVPRAGIQISFDWDSQALSGINSPYDVTLQYISRPPPNNEPVPVTVHQTTAWPDTTGTLTRIAVNADGVVRLGRPERVSGTLSGGLTFYRISGNVQPIAYTTYRLGGRSVLFADDYELAAAFEPTQTVGFNLGGDVNISIARGLALTAGYRYLGGPATDVPVRELSVLNPDEIFFAQTPVEIARQMALPPAHVSVASSRFLVGLKLIR